MGAAGMGSLPLTGWAHELSAQSHSSPPQPEELFNKWEGRFTPGRVTDETFWKAFASDFYRVSPDYVNLENGYFGVQPVPVQAAFLKHYEKVNFDSSRYMRTDYWADWQKVMQGLAQFCGADTSELLVTRNATEAMNLLINGFPFKPGDEVILQHHDYHSMIEAFQMLVATKGIRLKFVEVPLLPASEDEVLKLYESAISPVTTCILLTHLAHLTGQVLPVKKIADMAAARGVEVMVDAAHSFAHLDYKLPELGAAMVGVNLHKWFANPLGAGLLYVRKDKIRQLAPMYGDVGQPADSISKLGHFGTLASPTLLTIATAARFNTMLTLPVKQARLQHLKHYWASQARRLDRVEVATPLEAGQSCGIASFSIDGLSADDTVKQLFDAHGVFTVKRKLKDREVVRVTPGMYSSTAGLDRLLEGIDRLRRS